MTTNPIAQAAAQIPLTESQANKQKDDQTKLQKAASDLEGVFLSMVIKQMQATVPQDPLFNNNTTQMFTEMLDDQFGKLMAHSQGIGLAQQIVKSVQRLQTPQSRISTPGQTFSSKG